MRVQVLSDLHLEFWDFLPEACDVDVVILAGDIHVGRSGRRWIRQAFSKAPVVYVLGNHEFYNHSFPNLTETLKRESDGSHIHILENNSVEIAGWRILGCTLWTDFNSQGNPRLGMEMASREMSDYHVVMFGEKRRLRPEDTVAAHVESVAWLRAELAKGDPARTIVVTHHAPSDLSTPSYHKGSWLNPAFVSNLDELVEASRVPLWIHGHTHFNVDYRIGGTRVLSNQRGYPDGACVGFNPRMVIEL